MSELLLHNVIQNTDDSITLLGLLCKKEHEAARMAVRCPTALYEEKTAEVQQKRQAEANLNANHKRIQNLNRPIRALCWDQYDFSRFCGKTKWKGWSKRDPRWQDERLLRWRPGGLWATWNSPFITLDCTYINLWTPELLFWVSITRQESESLRMKLNK